MTDATDLALFFGVGLTGYAYGGVLGAGVALIVSSVIIAVVCSGLDHER